MRRTNKKGFTIVELVIVIAVIAILAAVLIPTFASLVNKANQSADIQAVRQMNTILATYTDGSIKTVADAVQALDKENIDLENYKPMVKDHYFYFYVDNGTPKIVYMDKEDKVVYPEDAKTDGVQLMSLSGEVPEKGDYKVDVSDDGISVSISSGAQFAHLMNNIEDVYAKKSGGAVTITLTDDIDLKGSSASFGEIKSDVTIDGAGKTISGVRADSNTSIGSWQGEAKTYGYALINWVPVGKTVKVSNLNISNVVVRDTNGYAYGHSGVLFGRVYGSVEIDNVTIDNCVVVGGDKAGALIGYLTGSATVKNVTVTNTQVLACAFAAKAIGMIDSTATVLFDSCDLNGVTTGLNEDGWTQVWYTKAEHPTNWDRNWNGEEVTTKDVYAFDEAKDSVTIGTCEYTSKGKSYTIDLSDVASEYHAKGNHYVLIDENHKTNGAYTDDYYWAGCTNTKATVNGQETNVHLSSSANRASALVSVEKTAD